MEVVKNFVLMSPGLAGNNNNHMYHTSLFRELHAQQFNMFSGPSSHWPRIFRVLKKIFLVQLRVGTPEQL